MMQIKEPKGPVGQPLSRVDGKLKVTGHAVYSAEAIVAGCVHAVMVQSTIASGKVVSMDTSAAEKSTGVVKVITHANMPKVAKSSLPESRVPLSDNTVHYAGQHLGVVIAETLEQARSAAMKIAVKYTEEKPIQSIDDVRAPKEKPAERYGDPMQEAKGKPAEDVLADPSLVTVRETYSTPVETHNPMEMSATIAVWEGEGEARKLTVWDATQAVASRRQTLAQHFELKLEQVRVISLFLGGGFGCKGDMWPHTLLAAVAARETGRPVKLMLTRQQMFTSCGHRPMTEQKVSLAADKAGKLQVIKHESSMHDSPVGHHIEPCGHGSSAVVYETPNLTYSHVVSRVNISSPTFMRAPGENPGMYALETAMDELAWKLGMDPLALRLANHSTKSPSKELPFSSKFLKEAYALGAEKFGWSRWKPEVGGMKGEKGELVGWGMATATYPAHRFPNQAKIKVMVAEGGGIRAVGQCATQDLGTGAYTVCTQMTAMLTGLPMERVKFELGDSNFPPGGVSGGSATTAGVGQALSEAATKLRDHLLQYAKVMPGSALAASTPDTVTLRGDDLVDTKDESRRIPIADILKFSGKPSLEGVSDPNPNGADDLGSKRKKYTFQSFGVHFVEVAVEQPIPIIRVKRVVSVMDIGQVVNPKTAQSQVLGGVVMGIGQALMEETHYDPVTFRPVNDNLADYPVPVNPDIRDLQAYFVGEPDLLFNAIGCRGVGEIGITGIAAAIGNAVYHATGKRVRDLPIRMDKLL